MKKSITASKKSRGRPKTTGSGTQVVVRMHKDALKRLDAWRVQQDEEPSRPEAVRRLVDEALKDK